MKDTADGNVHAVGDIAGRESVHRGNAIGQRNAAARCWTVVQLHGIALRTAGAGVTSVFKTMWKMPATLVRLVASESAKTDAIDETIQAAGPAGKAVIASGSLEEMVKAADSIAENESEGVMIQCVGRDRPIDWAEISGLRRATTFPAND